MKALAPHELEQFLALTKRQQTCYRKLVAMREADTEFADMLRTVAATYGGLFNFVKTKRQLSEMLASDGLGDLGVDDDDLQQSLAPE